jgi:lysophospholipase L1-like esterase
MRVLERNFSLVVFVLALAGCSVKGLNALDAKTPGLEAGRVDGRDAYARDAVPELTAEVSGADRGVDRFDVADRNQVVGDVSPEDGSISYPDSPSAIVVPDGSLDDRPVSSPDSQDVAVLPPADAAAPPDTRPVPDVLPVPPDTAPDAPVPDAFLGVIDGPLGEVDPGRTDANPSPDAFLQPDSPVMVPDCAPDGNADTIVDATTGDTGSVEAPVFIVSGGGRGPLSTTITTNSTTVDAVPTINNQTVRVMLRTTAAGSQVLVKLTNRFSTVSLPIGAAHVAIRSSGGSIVAGSDRTLTFDGFPTMTLGPGSEGWSDPVSLNVARGDTLAISLYVNANLTPTSESGRARPSWMNHYLSSTGDHTSAVTMPSATSGPSTTPVILFVSEIGVVTPGPAATLVALGDSITEGACSTSPNGDWPDLLSDRLPSLPDGTTVSVFNAGIGSGRFTSSDGAGLRGRLRLDELLLLPKVRWVTILMGVTDIAYEHIAAADLISAYQTAIGNAHGAGVKVIGIPILPFKNSVKDVGTNWATAQTVNAWIRSPGNGFDGIIDFEPVLDPTHSGAITSSLTCDGVHPNQAGYTAMANAIDLSIFR